MNILITGGAGFIGFHLAKHLAGKGYKISICDNLSRGKLDQDFKNLVQQDNVKFIQADLTEKTELDKLEKGYDHVYHLAAINGTRYFYEIPHQVLRVNLLSLINMLDWLRDSACKSFIWTSSSEVYAGTAKILDIPIPTPEDVPSAIDDVFNPRFSYACTKIAGELLCINYAREYGLNINIIRPHNIYGERMAYEHVIPEFITRIIRRENPFKIYGGTQTRAFCYVEDFIKGLKLVLESPVPSSEIINLGNDREEISIADLAEKLFDLFNFHPQIEILPSPKGSVDRRCPDIDRAKRLLGYEPQIYLEEGLRRTYAWYQRRSL